MQSTILTVGTEKDPGKDFLGVWGGRKGEGKAENTNQHTQNIT